mgnify:CR=1 FL=1
MANRKRKCKSCNEYKDAADLVQFPVGWFCSQGEAIKFAQEKQRKVREKAAAKSKAIERSELKAKKENLKTLSDWNKEAQAAINKYVRVRDAKKPCVSCGCALSINYGGTTDCGHYRSRGSASHLRFNLLNMAGQCSRCNRYLSGNIVEYRKELIKRIGNKRVDILECSNEPRKFDAEYLKRIKKIFNKKARIYERRFRA